MHADGARSAGRICVIARLFPSFLLPSQISMLDLATDDYSSICCVVFICVFKWKLEANAQYLYYINKLSKTYQCDDDTIQLHEN